jgi:hypothetical protein
VDTEIGEDMDTAIDKVEKKLRELWQNMKGRNVAKIHDSILLICGLSGDQVLPFVR